MKAQAAFLGHIVRSLLTAWGVNLLNVVGLGIGFAATMIIALYIRDELGFDRFIPSFDRILVLTSVYSPPNNQLVSTDKSPAGMASWLKADAPAVDAITRLHPVEWPVRSQHFEALEPMYWADSNLFDVLPLKVVAGNAKSALEKPYTMVLTRRLALRYFGRDDVVGRTLLINGNSPVTITAVLADLPANNSLGREIFISGPTTYGMLYVLDSHPDWQWSSSYTFLRLKDGGHLTPADVQHVAAAHWHSPSNLPVAFRLTPLADLHFQPEADSQMSPRGHRDTVIAMECVGALILFLATVNFAGLMTAQIDERNSEMAIRLSLGARRHHLFWQVMSEAIGIGLLGILVAMTLTERLLPVINPLLGLRLWLWSSPQFVPLCALAGLLVTLAGGLYPAIVLSAPPARLPRGQVAMGSTRYFGRVGWIAIQFALLTVLLISTQVIYQQLSFAMGRALKFDARNVLQIEVTDKAGQDERFRQDILKLPGVTVAAFSRFIPEETDIRPGWTTLPSKKVVQFDRQSVDPHFFDMFDVHLLAGKDFSSTYYVNRPPDEVVVSRSMAELLGYRRAQDAVGQVLTYVGDHTRLRATIIGVVEDMRVNTVREPLEPIVFDNQSFFFTRLNVKLLRGADPDTLAAIDQIWKQDYPAANPIIRHFYSEFLGKFYRDMVQQWWAFGLLSVVGICLSVLGLTSLSIYLARTRARELAIRNALGAKLGDLLRLRFAPLVRPLIVANSGATLLSWLLMSWWLASFSAHVEISPWTFLIGAAATVSITLVTLAVHAILTVPARSSRALRTA